MNIGKKGSKAEGIKSDQVRHLPWISVEVEDEDWKTYEAKLKSTHHILEEVMLEKEASLTTDSPGVEPNFRSPPEEPQSSTPPIPEEIPLPDCRVKLKKQCFTPAGVSAVGVLVIAVTSPLSLQRDSFITPNIMEFFSAVM